MSLLHAVLRKFYQPEAEPTAPAVAPEPDPLPGLKHYSPLFALLRKRQLLEIINDQTAERYQSIILDINVAAGLFMLDDLFPANPAQPVRVGDTLTLRHHYRGQVLSFSSPIIDIEHTQTAPLYTLKLPKEVGYRQRRRWPRVVLSQQPPLAVRYAKWAIDASQYLSVRDGLLLEAKSQAVCIRSQDAKEAVRAFMEKRTPRFSGQ